MAKIKFIPFVFAAIFLLCACEKKNNAQAPVKENSTAAQIQESPQPQALAAEQSKAELIEGVINDIKEFETSDLLGTFIVRADNPDTLEKCLKEWNELLKQLPEEEKVRLSKAVVLLVVEEFKENPSLEPNPPNFGGESEEQKKMRIAENIRRAKDAQWLALREFDGKSLQEVLNAVEKHFPELVNAPPDALI